MRRVNPKRRRRLYERNFKGPFRDYDHGQYVRTLPCAVPWCSLDPVQAAHVKARGMGGCKGDWSDLVPLCYFHHYELDSLGLARWRERYPADLETYAAELAAGAPWD